VSLPNDLGYTDAVSSFVWFKPTGVPSQGWHSIFGGTELLFNYKHTTGRSVYSIVTSNGQIDSYSENLNLPLDLNQWHHIGLTYDGANLRGYHNGVEVFSTPETGALVNSFSNRVIGKKGDEGYTAKGLIDEYRVYDKALSALEVSELYSV
jgi:hypothetical protein